MCACMCTCKYVYVRVCMYVCMYVCVCVCVCVCTRVLACAHVQSVRRAPMSVSAPICRIVGVRRCCMDSYYLFIHIQTHFLSPFSPHLYYPSNSVIKPSQQRCAQPRPLRVGQGGREINVLNE